MNLNTFNYVDYIYLSTLSLFIIFFSIKGATRSINYSLKIILSISLPFIFYKRSLNFLSGAPFEDLFDAVIGSDVATSLSYKLGDQIVVNHGLGQEGFTKHDDKPFRISGILRKTGTHTFR